MNMAKRRKRKLSGAKGGKCKVVSISGKRRRICRNKKGHITSNRKA
jgi:hypothetical protein